MLRNSFFKTIPFLFFIFLFNSCDKEFSVVGEDIIKNPSFGIIKEEFPVIAYNQKIEPIQSNNMPVNALGIYNNPSFGTTKATFVTQVALESLSNSFDVTAKIKSAVLTIPYFSHKDPKIAVGSDGSTVYILDSIYGPSLAKMKLSVYESGYFMRDLDPEDQFTQAQKYYTNQYSEFYTVKKVTPSNTPLNNSTNTAENELFFFDPAETVVKTTVDKVETITRSAPAMKLILDNAVFQEKILKAPKDVLSSNTLFKEHFRGLFFDIENIGSTAGNLAMINFKGGKITVTYTETIDKKEVEKSMVILLSGHTNNFLEEITTKQAYTDATNEATDIEKAEGVPNLYLKGGQGSLSVVKLFGEDKFGKDGVSGAKNGVPDRLDIMRFNEYLVNQAEITFHLNSALMGASYIPKRIYLYDYTNHRILADYVDGSSSSNPKNNRFIFGGILSKQSDADGGGYFYKFRITSHIQNLVKDSKLINVDLGLVVTEDISVSNVFYALRDKTKIPLYAPMASVMNPLGAVIFGNNIADEKNKIKFEIYYTKAN